ncbi:hypothetical protein [Haloactinomyces albus]|uniref:Uncharacterized protein n=1 Tax=Haloactinomyces albus TaxID=1352928 RepID=A0AAE4CLJ6_9ACTN|nr:hypothetical protein [Haloactinomyces albus]MDR7302335.1 hypothetical protein [Haloactinomyces albus]
MTTAIEFSDQPTVSDQDSQAAHRFGWFGPLDPTAPAPSGPMPHEVHWRFLRFTGPHEQAMLARILVGLRDT